MLMTDKST